MGTTASKGWNKLMEVPISFLSCIIKPIVLVDEHGKEYILITKTNSDTITKYDILQKKYTSIKNIDDKTSINPSTITMQSNSSNTIFAMDTKSGICNKIYINHEKNQYKIDFTMYKNKMEEIGVDSTSCYIMNEIHIVGGANNDKYFKYNPINCSFSTLHTFDNSFLLDHGMIYLSHSKQVLIFGGLSDNYRDKMFLYDIINTKMMKSKITLPFKMSKFGYVLYKNQFLIIFGGKTDIGFLDSIYVLDTKYIINNNSQWILNPIKCPIKSAFDAVMTKNGNIHLFQKDSDSHKHWVGHIDMFEISVSNVTTETVLKTQTIFDPNITPISITEKKTDENMYNEHKEKNNNKNEYNCDQICQFEFERFLEESLPDYENYLNKFKVHNMDNVRYINFLTKNVLMKDIEMKEFHQTVLLAKLKEYQQDYEKFKKRFKEINMFEKYYGSFDKNGIISYWSFYYHINAENDIKNIVRNINQDDLKVLWNSLSKTSSTSGNVQLEGNEATANLY